MYAFFSCASYYQPLQAKQFWLTRIVYGIFRKYKLNASCIIPLTKRSDVSNAPDFPIGSSVLAVYPGTTALYKAAVVGPQRKVKDSLTALRWSGLMRH